MAQRGSYNKMCQIVTKCIQLYIWMGTYYRDDVVLNRCWERRKPEERYHVNLHRKHQSTAHL